MGRQCTVARRHIPPDFSSFAGLPPGLSGFAGLPELGRLLLSAGAVGHADAVVELDTELDAAGCGPVSARRFGKMITGNIMMAAAAAASSCNTYQQGKGAVLRLTEKASRFENSRLTHKSITVAGNQTADKLWVLLPAGGDEPYVLLPLRLPPMLETKYTDGMSDTGIHMKSIRTT